MIKNKLKNICLPLGSGLIVVDVVEVVVVVVDVVKVVVVVAVVDVDVVVVEVVEAVVVDLVVVVVIAVVVVVVVDVVVVVIVGCISSSSDRHVVTMSSSLTSPSAVLTSHPLHCDRGHRTYLSFSFTSRPL